MALGDAMFTPVENNSRVVAHVSANSLYVDFVAFEEQ
jgi:hypothetical protein